MGTTVLYGIKDGDPLHISAVENGKACGCKCAACGDDLIARNRGTSTNADGTLRLYSFAHDGDKACPNAAYAKETVLHYLAKKILNEEKRILLPPITSFQQYGLSKDSKTNRLIAHCDVIEYSEARYFHFSKAELERKLHDIIPDVILTAGSHKIFVEIKITHGIDGEKFEKIKAQSASVIEIDLSGFDHLLFDERTLYEHVVHLTNQKRWVYNSKQRGIDRKVAQIEADYQCYLKDIVERETEVERDWGYERVQVKHIDGCSLKKRCYNGKFYANVDMHCKKCRFFKGVRHGGSKGICTA